MEETLRGFLPDGRKKEVNEMKGGQRSSEEATTDTASFAARKRR